MKLIEIKKDVLTDQWNVYIDNAPTIKSKSLLKVARSLYKFVKGQPEQ